MLRVEVFLEASRLVGDVGVEGHLGADRLVVAGEAQV